MKKFIAAIMILAAGLLFVSPVNADNAGENKAIAFTLADRDRILKLESRVDEGFKSVDQRFDFINKRIDKLESQMQTQFEIIQKQFDLANQRMARIEEQIQKTNETIQKTNDKIEKMNDNMQSFMMWIVGVLLGGMGIMVGLLFSDRRTALKPVEQKQAECQKSIDQVKIDMNILKKVVAKLTKKFDADDELIKELEALA